MGSVHRTNRGSRGIDRRGMNPFKGGKGSGTVTDVNSFMTLPQNLETRKEGIRVRIIL